MNWLISLDEVFDTRLGALHQLNVTYPKTMLLNNWHDRSSDREILLRLNVTADQWGEAYGRRNVDTLKNSIVNNLMNGKLIEYMNDAVSFPETEELQGPGTLFINTYPYFLSKEETDSLRAMINFHCQAFKKVEMISLPTKEITPRWIAGREIYYYFNYEGFKWLNQHGEALMSYPITRLKLIMPAMEQINAEPVTSELAEEFKDVNRFDMVGLTWQLYVTCQFLPAADFSIVQSKHKKEGS